jgi:hypothetical protein
VNARSEIRAAFDAEVARRHEGGLPAKQAELAACLQLVRDARTGSVDAGGAHDLIVEIEMENGRTKEAAELHAEAVLDGKPSPWAPRDYGYEKSRRHRRRPPIHDPKLDADPEMSAQLSAWANQALVSHK